MRILHLLSCRGWASDAYWAARMCRELERQGHEVTLCCRAAGADRVIDGIRREGVSRIERRTLVGGVRPLSDAADVRWIARRLREVDVVHVHRGKEHWLAALSNRLGPRRPLVRTRHIVQAVRPHAANRWLYRAATSKVIAVTESIRRQYIASDLLSPDAIETLPGGADADRYHPRHRDERAREALGARRDEVVVGMIGGLRVMKGHGVAIEALARLSREGLRPRVVIVGRGAMEAAIREAIARAGLTSHVSVTGYVEDLPALMASIDLALYAPLESDGMSRVVFEYLAAARPLIASRVGVVPDVLHDREDAHLVPAGDPARLAEGLRALVEDPESRRRLGAAGRRLVESRYSGARVAARLGEVYRAVS